MKSSNLAGQRFGRLMVTRKGQRRGASGRNTYWECKCDCGNIKEIWSASLCGGTTKSCGCLRRDFLFKDISGQRFGCLIAIKFVAIKKGKTYWECQCDCGKVKNITAHALRGGNTKSCGCLIGKITKARWDRRSKDEIEISIFKRYLWIIGLARRDKRQSKRRRLLPCTITVDDLKEQWKKQNGICPYTGWKMIHRSRKGRKSPIQASIDRIDNSLGYIPGNIQFVALMANYAKNDFGDELMIYFCKLVARRYSNLTILNKDDVDSINSVLAEMDKIGL